MTGSLGTAKARDAGIKNDPDTTDGVLNSPGGTLNKLDRAPVYAVGVGYRLSPLFRADLSFSMRNGLDLKDGEGNRANAALSAGRNDLTAKIRSNAAFLTGYVDAGSFLPANLAWVNPYFGVGLGYAVNRVSGVRNRLDFVGTPDFRDTTVGAPSGSSRGLAWQLATGLGFAVSDVLTIDLGYRFVDLGRLKVDRGIYDYPSVPGERPSNALKGELRTHELSVGLRYSF